MSVLEAVLETKFLPAERRGEDELARQAFAAAGEPLLGRLMDACGGMSVLLNDRRQIIRANAAFLARVGASEERAVFGLRFGEAVSCVWADGAPHGCGTTAACRSCGIAAATACAQGGRARQENARVRTTVCGADLELEVRATPLGLGGEEFVLISAEDAAPEARRRALEAIFLHDALNTASGVQGLVHTMADIPALREKCLPVACRAADTLVEEILSHRDLVSAERGDLTPRSEEVVTGPLLAQVAALFEGHSLARRRGVVIAPGTESLTVRTDRTLLTRVLVNLVKNALEAEPPERLVTLRARRTGLWVLLSVSNPTPMPESVQAQVFQRSFSTKGPGRGLGSYSARLLTERYLHGRIGFHSDPKRGTTFTVALPD